MPEAHICCTLYLIKLRQVRIILFWEGYSLNKQTTFQSIFLKFVLGKDLKGFSLWWSYSLLKSTLQNNENVDIYKISNCYKFKKKWYVEMPRDREKCC